MTALELVLTNLDRSESLSLRFRLGETRIAQKYFMAVQERYESGASIHEPDRTYNFPNDPRDRAWIARELNARIELLNAHSPGEIAERATDQMDQRMLNTLHHHFERCRGEFDRWAPFFRTAPPNIRRALEDFNLLIHQYEGVLRNEAAVAEGRPRQAKIAVTLYGGRYALAPDDLQQFRWDFEFGAWCLNYLEVGKTLWDMFRDRDTAIGDENIRPLRTFGADGKILFSRRDKERAAQAKRAFEAWLETDERMRRLGFRKDDPRNTVGVCEVARLDRDCAAVRGLEEPAILEKVGRFPLIAAVIPHAGSV